MNRGQKEYNTPEDFEKVSELAKELELTIELNLANTKTYDTMYKYSISLRNPQGVEILVKGDDIDELLQRLMKELSLKKFGF